MAMATRVFLLLLLFLISSLSPCFSLYEDQVGLMDWLASIPILANQVSSPSIIFELNRICYFKVSNSFTYFVHCRHQQYIGKVKHAVFHTQKAGRKRVVVSTEENVIASLDLRRGDICKSF